MSVSTFVLVHGAWHGAWCWERLVPELEIRGHAAIAMDLPVEDGAATFDDYALVVTEAAARVDGDVVLVGHSLGSMVIPLVAAARPTAALVFLCGVIPNLDGMPWDDARQMEEPGTFEGLSRDADDSTAWSTLEAATNAFYSDCTPDGAKRAYERLRRQNRWSYPEGTRRSSPAPANSAMGLSPRWPTRRSSRARVGGRPSPRTPVSTGAETPACDAPHLPIRA